MNDKIQKAEAVIQECRKELARLIGHKIRDRVQARMDKAWEVIQAEQARIAEQESSS